MGSGKGRNDTLRKSCVSQQPKKLENWPCPARRPDSIQIASDRQFDNLTGFAIELEGRALRECTCPQSLITGLRHHRENQRARQKQFDTLPTGNSASHRSRCGSPIPATLLTAARRGLRNRPPQEILASGCRLGLADGTHHHHEPSSGSKKSGHSMQRAPCSRKCSGARQRTVTGVLPPHCPLSPDL